MTRKNKAVFAAGVVVGAAFWWVASNTQFSFEWQRKGSA